MKKLTLAIALAISFPVLAEDGPAEVWKAHCKSCHGDDGKGKTKQGIKNKAKDMTTDEWAEKNSDADIKDAIANGESGTKMKAFKDKLSPAQIDALVPFIRAMKK